MPLSPPPLGLATLGLIAGLAVAQPALAGCDRPVAVRFAPGAFSSELTGGIPRGEVACFTIGAGAGQTLSVTQKPGPDNNIVFQIYQPGWKITRDRDGIYDMAGTPLRGAAPGEDTRTWSGPLPTKGTYLIVVGTTRGGGGYQLRVAIR